MRKLVACVSLAALLASGCGELGGGGSEETVEVNPKRVTPEALRAAVSDPRVKSFYEARAWAPVWTGERAEALTAAFADAARHAIQTDTFLKEAQAGGSSAEREAALTLAALNYARTLAVGTVDPAKVFEVYTVPRHRADIVGGLAVAAEEGRVREWLASLPPQDEEYRALSQAYLQYRGRAAEERRAKIESGDKIGRGDRDPRVPAVAEALRANGYLAPPPPPPEGEPKKAAPAADLFTAEMAAAVRRLQEDYGIKPDGIVGNATVEALNTGAVERARILAVNLERRRWLGRRPPPTRIDVNTAAAELAYWRGGALADRRVVVVGQPEWETPELGSPIVRLVANPPWVVPDSIAEEEILPKGPAYMASERISMVDGRLVQAPGPESALGLVKFDMANPHAIYLHDTPAKALFATTDRHASHGCVRVSDALGFARLIARDSGKLDAFERALASGEETPVSLPDPIPVRLLYHTAYLDGGRVVFRTDPYGWDEKLAQALGLGAKPLRPKVRPHVSDVGP